MFKKHKKKVKQSNFKINIFTKKEKKTADRDISRDAVPRL